MSTNYFNDSNIERCPHDEQNPYAQINRELIRDTSISPNCRWLIIYLLSNIDNWKISVKQVVNHVKDHMGRDKVYKLFDEAVEAGYMKKEVILIRRENNAGAYKSIKYTLSERPKFKKCFRHPENPDPENPDTENTYYKKEHIKENHIKEVIITPNQESVKNPEPPDKHPIPAGGNNKSFQRKDKKQLYPCLDQCTDLSSKQKEQMLRYDELTVEKAVKYCYHEKIKLRGPQARIKQMHDFCKNPELYEETYKNLDNPNSHKTIKELITSSLKKGERYNNAEFNYDDKGMSFHLSGSMYPYELNWKDGDFNNKFIEICKKLKLSIKLFPGIENFL